MISNMKLETAEAPQVVEKILLNDQQTYRDLIHRLQKRPPEAAVSLARGSSANASKYFDYLCMAKLGVPAISMPMSLITLHHSARMGSSNLPVFAFSQSGQSPDLIASTHMFRDNGSLIAAIVNDTHSPLAKLGHWLLPMHCGEELSKVATKSTIAQLFIGARIIAEWKTDKAFSDALAGMPECLNKAIEVGDTQWDALSENLKGVSQLSVIGRGTGESIAREAALKILETCHIQAEAFSGAEFRHGAMAIVDKDYPVLIIAPRGPAQPTLLQLAQEIRGYGSKVLIATSPGERFCDLPIVETGYDELDLLCATASLYTAIEKLSIARGFDPDNPLHMNKVTYTS
jgi:glucosamine--fructose-6-phosphate aminotransferase (isomerizing)